RADGDQRDDGDEDEFTPPDVEHQRYRSRENMAPSFTVGAARVSFRRLVQTALLPTSDRVAWGEAVLCSIDFAGSGLSTSVASSRIPFLKALMPWATSPIKSEILPRPNSRRTTAITTIQCQMLSEPILQLLQSGRRSIRPNLKRKVGLRSLKNKH